MATSDPQKRAIKAYTENLKAKGHRKVAFWLAPPHLDTLDRLAAEQGSYRGAVEGLLSSPNEIRLAVRELKDAEAPGAGLNGSQKGLIWRALEAELHAYVACVVASGSALRDGEIRYAAKRLRELQPGASTHWKLKVNEDTYADVRRQVQARMPPEEDDLTGVADQ